MNLPGPLPLSVDELSLPSERRHPEDEILYQAAARVDTYSPDQEIQISRIVPIRICLNPETFLEEGISTYIAKDCSEEKEAYDVRKTRALTRFEPLYGHYVDVTVGTALRKGVSTPENPGGKWQDFFDNVNLEGESITSFTKTLLTMALNGGVVGLMADYPHLTEEQKQNRSLIEGIRPYFTCIYVEDLLDCRSEIGQTRIGDKVTYELRVNYLRIKSEKRVKSTENEHFERVIPTVIVYDLITEDQEEDYSGIKLDHRLVRVRVYEKNMEGKDDEYQLPNIPENIFNLTVPYIAFQPCYGGKKEAFCRARPLHFDIARLNLSHWATSCDLNDTIHYNAYPMLTATGVKADENIFGGPARSLVSENSNARFGQVSPGMEGAELTLKELARLEGAMDRLAAIAMAPGKTLAESGFAKLLDRAQSDSQLAILLGSLEDSVNKALKFITGFNPTDYPEIRISISKNFIPAKLHSQQIVAITNLFKEAEAIDIRTFLEMLEAGEMFEGMHDFSVNGLLGRLKLNGSERFPNLPRPTEEKPSASDKNQPANLMDESSDGSLGREVNELAGEVSEGGV